MPEERDDLEKTEEPTPKRREEARKKGQVARSRSLIPAATLLVAALILHFAGEELIVRMERLFIGFFSLAGGRREIVREDLFSLSLESGLLFLPVLIPLFAGLVLAGMGGGFLQTGFLWTAEPLRPDLSRLNPLTGLRRLFSLEAAAELVKALLSLVCLGTLGFLFLYADTAALSSLTSLEVQEIVLYSSREGAQLIGAGAGIMAALAGLDYLYQRWRTEVKLRMSRHEFKEEMREHEGDPLIKSRLKSIRQKLARQRMMAEVAKADVVITNPQELAVALRYRLEEMAAPRVVGKGAGFIAQKIREVAREKGIPIVENKPLAQLLYRLVQVEQEIPETLYRAVAEALAYVYRLRRGQGKPVKSEEL
jgi:flagellar biosynthetic protein FlhB